MTNRTLPVIVLAGSDRQPVDLPRGGHDKHPLSGYKGVDVRIGGRTLIEVVIERLRSSGHFDPIYVVGPAGPLEPVRSCARLVVSDGTFGRNIKVSLEAAQRENPGRPIAFITSDVLPEVDTIRALMADYDEQGPCDMWFPMIRSPEDRQRLGASAWKPGYRIVPSEGEPAVGILPGHLVVVDPAALRLRFLYRLIQLGYQTRNRSITYRRGVMVRGVVFALLYQDLMHLLSFRPPSLTWSVMWSGITAGRELKAGTITRSRIEEAMRKIFVTSRHRRRHPDRRVLMPIVEGLSLAMDIDTEEEARQVGGKVETRSA